MVETGAGFAIDCILDYRSWKQFFVVQQSGHDFNSRKLDLVPGKGAMLRKVYGS